MCLPLFSDSVKESYPSVSVKKAWSALQTFLPKSEFQCITSNPANFKAQLSRLVYSVINLSLFMNYYPTVGILRAALQL